MDLYHLYVILGVCPLILFFGLMNFVMAYWAFKYVVMYVYQTRFETAGEMARNVLNRMFVALIFFQVYLLVGLKTRIDDFQRFLSIPTSWSLYLLLPWLSGFG